MRLSHLTIGGLIVGGAAFAGCGSGGSERLLGPENQPPVIMDQQDTFVVVQDTLRLVATATDPDADPLTFRLGVFLTFWEVKIGYRPEASLDEASGEFRLVPAVQDTPQRQFRFIAKDGRGGADSTQFSVAVAE